MSKFSSIFLLLAFSSVSIFSSGVGNTSSTDDLIPVNECEDFNFNQTPEFTTGPQPKGVTAADLDGDGLLDILASFQYTSAGFSVIRNLGGNRFAPKQDFTVPAASYSIEKVYTADLDMDGKIDVLLSGGLDDRMLIYRNISSGPGNIDFAPRIEYTTGAGQMYLAFGDFDGDGKIDVAASNKDDSTLSVLRNSSAGIGAITLAPKVDFSLSSPGPMITGDFDNDGKLDIAVGSYNGSSVRVLKNTSSAIGDINFSISPYFNIANRATGIDAADLDADGKLDIVTSNANSFSILRNISSDTINFAPRQDVTTGAAPYGIVAEDFNGDGKIDIATANNNGNSVSISLNTGTTSGIINFAARSWDFGVGLSPYYIAAADINSDGKMDVITPNRIGDNVSLLINRSSAENLDFGGRKEYLTPLQAGVTNVEAADFDRDGKLDLVTSFYEVRNVFRFSIYRNDGSGHFPTRLDFLGNTLGLTTIEPYYISTGDFNNDGKIDLVMTGYWRTTSNQDRYGLLVLRNTSAGPGNFSFSTSFAFEFQIPYRVFVADIDGDGLQDIAATHRQSSPNENVMVFRNNGSMNFSLATSFIIPNSTSQPISFADLNSDNKLDMVYTVLFSSNSIIRVHLNTGAPGNISFASQDLSPPFTPLSAIPGDIDNDGQTDLVSSDEQKIYVLKNTSQSGVLSFDTPIGFQTYFAVKPVRIVDMDGDGRKDVLTQNLYLQWGHNVIWKNTTSNGIPNLIEQEAIASGGNSSDGAVLADLDGNGKLDIVNEYNSQVGGVSVLLNQACVSSVKTPFDFDGDNKTDISIFRSPVGEWWYLKSSNGDNAAFQFGNSADRIAPADFTGDGKTDIAIFRPSTGEWFVLRSDDNSYYSFPFGTTGDVPAPADFDGDGKADATIFRPSDATWYISQSSGGTIIRQFGQNGDVPVVADYDGDGKADIAIYRSSAGEWWISRSQLGVIAHTFGNSMDKPVQGDYTGDGKADAAIWRSSTGEWFILRSENGSYYSVPFGTNGDAPAPGDFDGDGKFDTAVFRPSEANWYVQRSTAGTLIQQFGQNGDLPVPSAFVR